MKKPTPMYLFVVITSLFIAGFALFIISVAFDTFFVMAPIVFIIIIGTFFMYIAKRLNTGQFAERLERRVICYKCKEEIPSGTEYCPECGANLFEQLECDYCGHMNPMDATECQNCQANLR